VLHVTGHEADLDAARKNALALAKEIVIPGMFYRHDIGEGAGFSLAQEPTPSFTP